MVDKSQFFGLSGPNITSSPISPRSPGSVVPGKISAVPATSPTSPSVFGPTATGSDSVATTATTTQTPSGSPDPAIEAGTTITPSPSGNPPGTTPNTGGGSGSRAQAQASFEDNILGNYNSPTYHLRFYTRGARVSGGRPIIIAESGITGYNITELSMTTMAAPTETHRNVFGIDCRLVIKEPLGTSFLDSMLLAAGQTGAENWTHIPYLIDISFKGYDDDGKENPNICKQYQNGGVWTYEIRITNIDVHMDSTGGTYTITGILFHNIALDKRMGLTIDPIHIPKAENLGDLFKQVANTLNKSAANNFGPDHYTYSFKFLSTGSSGSLSNPEKFKFSKGSDDKKDPYRLRSFANEDRDKQGANIPPGTVITDIVTYALASTEEGQKMLLSTDGRIPSDEIGDGRQRESGMFRVYPLVTLGKYNPDTNTYAHNITYVVKMYRAMTTQLRGDEITRPGNSQQAVQMLLSRAGLVKKYEYIFTGLNTEVLEFDIKYNLVWSALVPKMKGYNYYTEGYATSAEYNKDVRDPARESKMDSAQQAGGNAQAAMARATDNHMDNFQIDTAPGTVQPNSVVYVENLLTQQRAKNPLVPPVGQENNTARRSAGTGIMAQWHRGKSVFGTLMDQIATTTSMNEINLKIKGDPFWLGQGYDAMIRGGVPKPAPKQTSPTTLSGGTLPSYAAGDNCFALYFRYPYNWGETGNYVFRDNDVYNGVYVVKKVIHNFANGMFTQTLESVRIAVVTPDDVIKLVGSQGIGSNTSSNPPDTNPPAANPAPTNPNQTGSTGA